MASASVGTTYYWYNSGWNTQTIGNSGGYISSLSNGRVTIQPITVAPSSGYKITSITFKFGVAAGSGAGTVAPTIYCQAYNSLANAQNKGDTGKVGSRGSYDTDTTSSGSFYTVTMTGFNITASTTLYILIYSYSEKYGGYYMQYWPRKSGNITALPTVSVVESINGYVYVYNGSAWKKAIPYVYNGSAWKQAIPYAYNGSAWKICGG